MPSENVSDGISAKPSQRVHALACTLHKQFMFHAGYACYVRIALVADVETCVRAAQTIVSLYRA
ncbi:hypothetical protein D0T90_10230 [Neisseria animalis]|uniref:Uncharacterized protein n=1 Tax=Neisseria animalis TaxID=492 RepID=A0A5P3MTE5_NEIAN|nr:hypothetical protein D0T90_10230 [Neisseria animalis]ROW31532.1 hypothetical protein CGZ60_09770 [Neisseria animalis]